MLINDSNLVPVQLLNGLKPKTFIQSYRTYPIRLEIDEMPTGSYFLNLFISRIQNQIYRLLVEISESRLLLISKGEMSIDFAYLNPENNYCYAALFEEENITQLSLVSPFDLLLDNPIPQGQFLSFDLNLTRTSFDLVEYARKRGRIIIEVKTDSKIIYSNLRYGSVKNLLVPFLDLIKTAALDHNTRLSPKNVDDYLGLGFSYIGIGSLHAVMELNHHLDLFGFNTELENLLGLLALFRADDPSEILKCIKYFKNKKIIPDYIRLLRSISKSGSSYLFQMATSFEQYNGANFDWARGQIIKNIIESSLPETMYDEIVSGTLTSLDFENKKRPVFSLRSSSDERIYSGFIDPSLDPLMNRKDFQFCRKVYDCTLQVVFIPETLKKAEQYRYTLLRIEEVQTVGGR